MQTICSMKSSTGYGDPPKGVMNLIAIALLRARAASSGIVELSQKGQTLTVKLGVFDFAAISSLCEEASFKGRVFFAAGKRRPLQ